jgi:hypothetical protein
MAQTSSLPCLLALVLALVPTACTAEVLVEAPATEIGASTAADPACQGDDPATFCDDCNPCTEKANCTPCSALPASERDIYHCTADEELPGFCAGRTGCFHVPLTTPEGQSASCFPVADATEARAGVCDVGRCVDGE